MIGAKARPRAQSLLGSQASMPVVSTKRTQAEILERVLLWAFVAALAWCPFWFGSNVLLTWGINSILFPGLVAIYELSLLIEGKRHPVAIRQIKLRPRFLAQLCSGF